MSDNIQTNTTGRLTPCLQQKIDTSTQSVEDKLKRAYIQGYADCVQALYHMGLLKENEGLKWAEKIDVC